MSKGRVLLINNDISGTRHVVLVQLFDVQPHVVTGKSGPHADGASSSEDIFHRFRVEFYFFSKRNDWPIEWSIEPTFVSRLAICL